MKLNVLYEDNHVIAVEKPAGVLVQGDESGEASLMEHVKEYIKEKYKKPGNVFLGLLHRLDRNVSGVVVLAKTSKGASRLSEQFRDHTVEKIYHAWVEGKPEPTKAVLKHYLRFHEGENKALVYEDNIANTQYAELSYEVLEHKDMNGKTFSLVKIILKTGRHHQIRAQLAYMGYPIVGDLKYGSKTRMGDRKILLVATSLTFTMATVAERKTVEVALPVL